MPLRRDSALWFNMAGVVAAWQPVAAPWPLAARYSQAHGQRSAGSYTLMDGVAPTWSPITGLLFNGTDQYLRTGIIAEAEHTIGIRYAQLTANDWVIGASDWAVDANLGIDIADWGGRFYSGPSSAPLYDNAYTAATKFLSNRKGYTNGILVGDVGGSLAAPDYELYIGARNAKGAPDNYTAVAVLCAVVIGRELSAAEIWNASRQMAYCHTNPEWSAWGRRRRYYYAPAAPAGGAAKMNTYYRRMRS